MLFGCSASTNCNRMGTVIYIDRGCRLRKHDKTELVGIGIGHVTQKGRQSLS